MQEFLWQAFVTLLVIVDPFAVVPVFVNLTQKDTTEDRRRTAKKSSLIALILLLGFAVVGDKLLYAMGISQSAFQIAGGFLLLLAAVDMVVAKGGHVNGPNREETREASHRDDISVFPLAIPLIAGPGALTSMVVIMQQAQNIGWTAYIGALAIVCIVVGITYGSMLVGHYLMRYLGVTGTNVLTRVFGIILAALAIENMLSGFITVAKKIMGLQ